MSKNKTWAALLWRILSGYETAIICMVLLLIIVFFSTLEQADEGLYIVRKRYYDLSAYFVQPKLNGKLVPLILPGAYWVCVVFTINLICGGLIRMSNMFFRGNPDEETLKKRVAKGAGVLIAHFSMVFLMISGAVTYHLKESTLLLIPEGMVNRVAYKPEQICIEVRNVTNNANTSSYVIKNEQMKDLIIHNEGEAKPLFWKKTDSRSFRIKDMPFTIKLDGWHRNVRVLEAEKSMREQGDGEVVNKVFLRGKRAYTDTEIMMEQKGNIAGCYLTVIPDDKSQAEQKLVMWQTLNHPVTLRLGDQVYGFSLTTEKVLLPFNVQLDELIVEKYQGSNRDKAYNSYVTYMGEGGDRKFFIKMNQPMRHKGYTLFQTSVGQMVSGPRYSVYEVVKNPSDQWPKYSIYMCAFGLLIHFVYRLFNFVNNSMKGGKKDEY